MKGNLFSDSWYKVADLRVSLLNQVDIQKQYYRGDLWYVLRDSFNNSYFRVTPEAYNFIAMLTPARSIEAVWEKCLEIYKENAPSQEEVIDLLSQLHGNNLLYFKNAPNNEFIFERHREKKQREIKGKFLSVISFKIPLWNPDAWLNSILPIINAIISLKGLLVWFIVVLLGTRAIVDNFNLIYDKTQGIFSQSNLIFFYLALAILKLFHEIGHGAITKRFGGGVQTFGVMFLVFTPLPYMDATSSWFFQNRWQRILVSSAGMIVDLFFAAIAAIIWANTGDGMIHSLAFNAMVIGSVSSILFNGNPLIRFDAYYILSDALEIPNLYQRSRQQWAYWIERYAFDAENVVSPSDGIREAFWLAFYAAVSLVYRTFLTIVIGLYVADKFFAIGLIMVMVAVIVLIFIPVKKFFVYLFTSPKLYKKRKRAVAISFSAAVIVLFLVGIYPFSYSIRAPGIVESKDFSKVYATTEGVLDRVNFDSGDFVKKDEVIATISNYELTLKMRKVEAELNQIIVMKQKAMNESTADLKPLSEKEKMLREQAAVLRYKKENLSIIAQSTGVFVSPDIELLRGRFLKRQTQLGTLIANNKFTFSAIVSQEKAFDLFKEKDCSAQVRLYGNSNACLTLQDIMVIPYQKEELPSAALGLFGGGDIQVATTEKSGKKTTEAFFEINGKISEPTDIGDLRLLHGRSGILRLTLPPKPLAVRIYRMVKQTIQKRYRI